MAHQRLGLLLCAALALLHAEALPHLFSNIRGPVQVVNTVRSSQACSTWGKYRYKMFDGSLFQLKSDCTYLLTSSCSSSYSEFSVQIRRVEGKGGRSIITWVLLTLDGVTVEITPNGVLVNGKPCNLPLSYSGVRVEKSYAYIKVKAKLGLTALWCPHCFLVELDSKYQGQTCGLCGDFNGDPHNDFFKDGRKLTLYEFARLWRRDNPEDNCPDINPEPTPPGCTQMRPLCENLLYSHAFSTCHSLVDVEPFIAACCEESCHCSASSTPQELSDCVCDTLSEFSRLCVRKGGNPGPWRTKELCWKPCPQHMEYRECCSAVTDTCSNPEASRTSNEPCIDGCFCPDGTVLDDLTEKGCIPVTECSCSYNGNLYAPGQGYSSKCSKCVCEGGQWACTEINCPGTCSLQGGSHISTFDGKTYSFHGNCTYTMAKDCSDEEFVIQVELRQCGPLETQTCLKEVVLALNGGVNVVTIRSCGEVLVNGIYAQLPFSAVGVIAFQPSSFFILVQTSVGVHLVVQLLPIMQVYVTVQSQHRDQMCGLCGNFNGNQADDFLKLSGVEDATGAGFANSWKTSATCINVWPVYLDPCSLSHEKEEYAQRWCSHLTDPHGVFAVCHAKVCPEAYKQRCMYDSCNCEHCEDCMCAAVSSYVHACSGEGVQIVGWRDVLCGKYVNSCPSGMVYSYSITSGPGTCRARFSSEPCCHMSFEPLDGCVCAPGTFLDDSNKCVPPKNCPCYRHGRVLPPGQRVAMKDGFCTCRDGFISCVGIPPHIEPPVRCTPPLIYFKCSDHGISAKGKECEKSCSTLDTDCLRSGCESGCMCPPGLISDDHGGCIEPEACPCIHNGKKFPPGQSIKVDCNTCTCKDRKWVCTKRLCDSTCTVYGSGHFKTFDHHRFNFEGSCDYILVQDYCDRNQGSFKVVLENVPAGSYGTTCSKNIKILFQDSKLVLTQGSYELEGSAAPFRFTTIGLYLVIEINNGLVLIWNRNTILFIKISQSYKSCVCGLCGNFDGNANNDQTTCCGAMEVNPLVFGNSWKDSPDCPDVPPIPNPCVSNPYLHPWSQKQCNFIHSSVFSTCHLAVDPLPYYEACVFDTCSCETKGDCDILCTAIAAYAEACNQAGICVDWRTPKFCPIVCDFNNPSAACEWHYKPCGDPCMRTCRNPSGFCSNEIPPLEGCYPECPPHLPYFDEVAMICVTKEQCGCKDIDGNHYNNGDTVPTSENCRVCTCVSSTILCEYSSSACVCIYNGVPHPFGSVLYNTNDGHGNCFIAVCGLNGTIHHDSCACPETPPTPYPKFTTPCNDPSEETCFWTRWINSDHPKYGFNGGDDETIVQLLHLGYEICEHPVEVECRAARYPGKSLADLGQSVTCNTVVGLLCRNKNQFPPICLDYEIRMKCCKPECSTEQPTPCDPTTESTTSCHTTPPPTTSTTECPGGVDTEWSQWFNFGHPTPGHFGQEVESIQGIIAAGFSICSSPVAIECRAVLYPGLSPAQLGQVVTCDKNIGLVCKNIQQGYKRICFDYEIRVKCCECHTTATTTCHTTPPPTTSTTECPGGGQAEWSEWFNLGHPTPGPFGKEVESIQGIIAAGFPICSSPVAIECRAVLYPGLSPAQLGQVVTCDINIGLVCKNIQQGYKRICFDYEIRVKCCECHTTATTTCHPPTESTTTCHPTPSPTTECPGGGQAEWSEWFNLGHPTPGPFGQEVESIQGIIAAGFPICSSPVAIECRAVLYPGLSPAQLGQVVICDKNIGLVCKNIKQGYKHICFNYEIRVKCCECHTTATTTCHPPTESTTTCHPTPSPTTECPGGGQAEWSEWFNLGHPTPGPYGQEVESIQGIIAAGFPICSNPVAIECRAVLYPGLSPAQLGQVVICDKNIGLVCKNIQQGYKRICFDYEIRVKCCECHTTATTTCHPPTESTTTCHPTPSPTTECPGGGQAEWSEWFNLGHPTPGPYGQEVESIQGIIAAGFPICSNPVAIECRAVLYPGLSPAQLGQVVICDKNIGLVCKNIKQGYKRICFDYEIRVKCCECHTTATTTCHPPTESTTTCHPTPSPTTECPGGGQAEWSEWFNLGHPTPGPYGQEVESIQGIIAAGFPICSNPVAIECRAVLYPGLSPAQLGQVVICDKNIGLVCKNIKQGYKRICFDYEIRVKCCECHTTATTTCHPPTESTTTCHPTPSPTTECPGGGQAEWSEWFNLGHPTPGPYGQEVESIQGIIAAGFPICSNPVAIECRAVLYPGLSPAQLGQVVTCDKNIGLVCKNIQQGYKRICFDYEIRVKCCECHTTATTTCHPPTESTTTCHPTPSPTTECPGGGQAEWSEWFNLGHPTPGPYGQEVESIQGIIAAGFPICSNPVAIECRAVLYPGLSPAQLGQVVICDKNIGLVCKNIQQGYKRICFDYEIRVKCCECHTTATTTCHPPTESTTTCHPTPSPTTECPGGGQAEWSEWFNLGHPTPGPFGQEVESIQGIIAAGFPICSNPVAIECRAVLYPGLSPAQLGQVVICDKNIGLVCKNIQQGYKRICFDYEIRVKCCECHTTATTTCHPPTESTTTCHTTASDCHCFHHGVVFPPGSIVYNYTDPSGYCYVGYCNEKCVVVVSHYQCHTPSLPPKDCLHLRPPRKDGETWKKSGCRIATCKDGKVTISAVLCPIPEPIWCVNNLPPVKVYDEDGCCFHYECQCLCYGWGDPHYLTFDGTYYSFQGSCSYWLVKEVFPRYGFSVMVTNGECAEPYSTCIQSITVFYNQYKIYMSQHNANNIFTNLVLVDDKPVSCAYQNAGIRITTTGITSVLLIPKILAKITFSARAYSILLPFSLFGSHTQGQCGKCNNNRGDDCIAPDTQKDCCQQMAHEWHTKDEYCHPPPDITLLPTPPPCDTTICDILKNSVFEDCHGVVDFQSFYTACVHDVRNSVKQSEGCLSLQMYALSCSQAGVCVDWRSSTAGICDYTCTSPKVYDACGPPVEPTCDSWFNHKFIHSRNDFTAMLLNRRLEGCYCPSGTTLLSAYSSECVPTCEICRLPNGKFKKANDKWIAGCEVCRCDEDTLQVVCEPKNCPLAPYIIKCDQPGQVLVTDIVDCCPRVRCECDKSQCTGVPSCPLGQSLKTTIGVCCDRYDCVPKHVCVFNNHEYEIGDVVPRFPCERCVCSKQKDPATSLHQLDCVSISCDTHCVRGYVYQLKPGECCGTCVQTHCLVNLPFISHILEPEEVWSPPGDPCVTYKCVHVGNQFLTVEARTKCPPLDLKDCIPGTETVDADGCCKVCIPRGHPCSLSSSIIILESQGCKSKKPVNITSCRGACGTFTFFSAASGSLQRSCSCCQEVSTSERKVDLVCPDYTHIAFTYTHIEACACLKAHCTNPVGPYPLPHIP